MKKIMFYINRISDGGAERVVVNLASQFSEAGFETIVVTSFRTLDEYVLDERVKRYSLENEQIEQSRIKRNISRIRKLRNICKEEMPDVLISFMAEPNFRALIATWGLRIKNIISVRNDPNMEYAGKLGRFVGKILLPFADGCVFQTDEAREWFPSKLQNKSKIIFNAVKEDFFEVERKPIENRIVTCGRLVEQKNHKMLIDAFANINKEIDNVSLHIYGDGNLRDFLESYIKHRNLQDKVVLKGNTANVQEVLANAEIFVLSSDYEGMPNALMEALAVGVPSISTDCPCGGPRMLISNEINGILVPVKDVEALSSALRKLLINKLLAKQMGERAKEKANDYQPKKIFLQWKDYVEKVAMT